MCELAQQQITVIKLFSLKKGEDDMHCTDIKHFEQLIEDREDSFTENDTTASIVTALASTLLIVL